VRRAAAAAFLAALDAHPYAAGLAPGPVLPAMLREAAAGRGGRASSAAGASSAAAEEQAQEDAGRTAQAVAAAGGGSGGGDLGDSPLIRVLCRTPGQVAAALEVPWLEEVILDFLEVGPFGGGLGAGVKKAGCSATRGLARATGPMLSGPSRAPSPARLSLPPPNKVHGLREAVAAVRAAGRRAVVALPRILKPDEQRLLLFYLRLAPDALLIRGAGALQQLLELGGEGAEVRTGPSRLRGGSEQQKEEQGGAVAVDAAAGEEAGSSGGGRASPLRVPRLEGDFSLNAANALAAGLLLDSGLARLALTYDLNAAQLAGLARGLGPARAGRLEAIVHGHLPIFHTEHCVFARFLSDGGRGCGCGGGSRWGLGWGWGRERGSGCLRDTAASSGGVACL
jgi:putative protease